MQAGEVQSSAARTPSGAFCSPFHATKRQIPKKMKTALRVCAKEKEGGEGGKKKEGRGKSPPADTAAHKTVVFRCPLLASLGSLLGSGRGSRPGLPGAPGQGGGAAGGTGGSSSPGHRAPPWVGGGGLKWGPGARAGGWGEAGQEGLVVPSAPRRDVSGSVPAALLGTAQSRLGSFHQNQSSMSKCVGAFFFFYPHIIPMRGKRIPPGPSSTHHQLATLSFCSHHS